MVAKEHTRKLLDQKNSEVDTFQNPSQSSIIDSTNARESEAIDFENQTFAANDSLRNTAQIDDKVVNDAYDSIDFKDNGRASSDITP